MKKVGFITSPLSSGHAVRGVGFYTKYLLEHLKPLASEYGMEIIEIPGHELRTTYPSYYELIHYPFFDLFSHTLPIFNTLPSVVTIHDVVPLEYPDIYRVGFRSALNLFLQKTALTRVRKIITDSVASKTYISQLLSVPANKIVPIHLAAGNDFHPVRSVKVLSSIRSKYHLPDKFVLYVGDINWNKNLTTLVAACIDRKLPLVLVGKHIPEIKNLNFNHPELAHLRELSGLLSDPHVFTLGFVPSKDMSAIYSLATVYCQPSFAEGFGLPILEAFACGTPVVCSRTHSLPEIGGDAPIYFDPYNVQDLSDKLMLVWQDHELCKSLSFKGLQQVTKFSWDKTAQETLQVYVHALH